MDARQRAAQYYDANPVFPKDIPFYRARILSPHARVLELGCGTGRVLLSLLEHCSYLHGVDCSEAMLALCRRKLKERAVPAGKVCVDLGDITNLSLPMQFDLVIAPFRVLQLLVSDDEVEGLFRTVRRHLAPGGTCILTAFNPKFDPQGLLENWVSPEEILIYDVPYRGGRLTCHKRRLAGRPEKQIFCSEVIYRWFEGEVLKDQVIEPLAVRCYDPDQFLRLIEDHGFRVIGRWGGYAGEPYGEGKELVVQFTV